MRWNEIFLERANVFRSTHDLALFNHKHSTLGYYRPKEAIEALRQDSIKDLLACFVSVADKMYDAKNDVWRMGSIWAVKGFGPTMYMTLIQDSGKSGLTKNQLNFTSGDARKVWQGFVDGKADGYVNLEPISGAMDLETLNFKAVPARTIDLFSPVQNNKKVMKMGDASWEKKMLDAINKLLDSRMSDIY